MDIKFVKAKHRGVPSAVTTSIRITSIRGFTLKPLRWVFFTYNLVLEQLATKVSWQRRQHMQTFFRSLLTEWIWSVKIPKCYRKHNCIPSMIKVVCLGRIGFQVWLEGCEWMWYTTLNSSPPCCAFLNSISQLSLHLRLSIKHKPCHQIHCEFREAGVWWSCGPAMSSQSLISQLRVSRGRCRAPSLLGRITVGTMAFWQVLCKWPLSDGEEAVAS